MAHQFWRLIRFFLAVLKRWRDAVYHAAMTHAPGQTPRPVLPTIRDSDSLWVSMPFGPSYRLRTQMRVRTTVWVAECVILQSRLANCESIEFAASQMAMLGSSALEHAGTIG